MPLFGSSDAATNAAVIWVQQLKVTPNSANRTAAFGNSTGNSFFTGRTDAIVAVDVNEMAASVGKIPHTGWHLRTTGSGGRAGRVSYECLVAGGIGTDASDDVLLPDASLYIVTHPSDSSILENANTTFGVVAAIRGVSNTITYQWQVDTGNGTFTNVAAAGVYSNVTTATLFINSANLTISTFRYRALVDTNEAVAITSNPATLTVT